MPLPGNDAMATVGVSAGPKPTAKPIQPKPKTGSECARCGRVSTEDCRISEKSFRLCPDCANVVLHVVGLERRVRVKAE